MLRLGASLLIASLAVSASARGAPSRNATATLQKNLRQDLQTYLRDRGRTEHLSALSLAVSLRPGSPTMTVTAGTVRYGSAPAVTPMNLYQIGSNTKAFTAVAVLQLEAQGRLSIDALLRNYLPQYPAYGDLTLRRLLNMTSGLESYDNLPSWEHMYASNPLARVSADTLIRLVYPKRKYPAGSKYYYSNTGYLLAQEVVAARSKSKSFDAEMARIISSAGLKDTFYTSHLYPPQVATRVVAGYYENNDRGFGKFIGQDTSGYSLSWGQGAGSIVATPSDLVKWARELYGGALLPKKQQRELLALVSTKTAKPLTVATASDPAGFALGVAQRFDPKLGLYWFYQGETLGYRAAHLYFPKSGLVVALFANSRPVESNSKLHQLFSTIYATITRSAAKV